MPQETGIYEVQVTAFSYGGDVIGRLPDGRAVFVPFAIPGERVRIQLIEEKRGFARARLLEVVEPSPDRIAPLCIHFGVCGGCDYQHIPYEMQVTVKTNIVRDQLQRIAGIQDPPVRPAVPSPSSYYYRNNVQFHQDETGRLGYIKHESNDVLAITECHLPEPVLNESWPLVDLERIEGLDRIGMRIGLDEEVLVSLESEDPQPPELDIDLPFSVVHLSPAGSIIMAGDDYVLMQVLDRTFKVSAGSFFQVNTEQAEAMVRHLLDWLPLTRETVLLDLYCGVGLFTAFLAPLVKQVVGVEVAEPAVDDFATNLDEFDNVEVYLGAAEEILPGLKVKPDIVLVDPPRTGLDRRALDALVAMKPRFLAYVSCDVATLSRDVKRLVAAGYELFQVTPFDLFPQTGHIETITLMQLGSSR